VPLRRGREAKVDASAALRESTESLARADADVAAQKAQLARGKAVLARYEKMIEENNLAELVFEAFSQAYQRRHP
jgi:hypothetical protein